MNKKKLSVRNMSVRSKLLTNSAVALCMIVVLAVVSIVFLMRTNDSRLEDYTVYAERQIALSDAYVSFNKVRVDIRDFTYLYEDDKEAQAEKIAAL